MDFNFILSLIPYLDTVFGFLMRLAHWSFQHPVEFILTDTLFTWAYYLSMCSLKRAYDADNIPKFLYPVVYPLVLGFLLSDFLFNVTVGTILFLKPPTTWLFTGRCAQYKLRSDWRSTEANFWCEYVLNPFWANGHHC